MRLGRLDEGCKLRDPRIDVGLVILFCLIRQHVECAIEVGEETFDILAQRSQFVELRVKLGKPLVERLLVIRKGLHPVGKRTLRRLLDRSNLVGELVARGIELLEAAGDAVLGSQIGASRDCNSM